MADLSPLDAGLLEIGAPALGLPFPPVGWRITQPWGFGYALEDRSGLLVLIDCERKEDDRWWVHISVSRSKRLPSYEEMARIKVAFLGDRYAYSVWAPVEMHVNIMPTCLHLWGLVDTFNGQALPEFSAVLSGIGRSI